MLVLAVLSRRLQPVKPGSPIVPHNEADQVIGEASILFQAADEVEQQRPLTLFNNSRFDRGRLHLGPGHESIPSHLTCPKLALVIGQFGKGTAHRSRVVWWKTTPGSHGRDSRLA